MQFRESLEQATCSTPGCDHTAHDGLFLHGRCHQGAPVTVEYRAGGVLLITCAICRKLVVEIAVASSKSPQFLIVHRDENAIATPAEFVANSASQEEAEPGWTVRILTDLLTNGRADVETGNGTTTALELKASN